MKPIRLFVNIEPTRSTHQSSLRVLKGKGGRFFVGKMSKSSHKKWVKEFESLISAARPDFPLNCETKVYLGFHFSHLKSTGKKAAETSFFKTTRPDLDNLEKSVLDSLVRTGFLVDDSLVCDKHSQKFHSPKAGIEIRIEAINTP